MKDILVVKYIPHPPSKIRIETPVGAIESDSGSHIMDGFTIVILILVLYLGKKIVDKYFKKKCCCRK